jgi:hypothetical protein
MALRATTIPAPDADLGVRRELAELRARVEVLEQRVRSEPIPADDTLALQLVPALALILDDTPFMADFVSDTQDPNIRFIVGKRSARSIGKFLSRIKGRTFGDYVIIADGKSYNRHQWRLRRAV